MAKRGKTYLVSQASQNAAGGSPTGIYDTLGQQITLQDTLTEAQRETQERADIQQRIRDGQKHSVLKFH
jgi:hypothetical protein